MSEPSPIDEPKLLEAFLHERDNPCPRCGYNLRNLLGPRCPECGDELVLRVSLSEPKLAAFLTAVVGLAVGAGFNGLLLVFCLIEHPPAGLGLVLAVFFALTLLGLLSLLSYRSAMRRMPPSRQWLTAVLCWALSVIGFFAFVARVR